jgi:hypothetical protein
VLRGSLLKRIKNQNFHSWKKSRKKIKRNFSKMEPYVNLIVKVQQFEDKRIAAKASWNIRELKGKLSEIYPTVSSK